MRRAALPITARCLSSPNTPSKALKGADRKSTRLNSSHSLRDALPIYPYAAFLPPAVVTDAEGSAPYHRAVLIVTEYSIKGTERSRSEEHTSELQSLPTRRSSDLSLRGFSPAGCGNGCGGQRSLSPRGAYRHRILHQRH